MKMMLMLLLIVYDVTINSLFVIVAILGNCLFVQFPVLVQMILYLSNNKQKDE